MSGQATAAAGWARLQARGGRQVRVPWTRDDDGRVRLPAFYPGPLEILEVGVPGRWRTAVLKNVAVTGAAVDVTLPIEWPTAGDVYSRDCASRKTSSAGRLDSLPAAICSAWRCASSAHACSFSPDSDVSRLARRRSARRMRAAGSSVRAVDTSSSNAVADLLLRFE